MQNNTWIDRSLKAVWHPCTQMKRHETFPLIPIAKGEGAWLYDFEGNRYLDSVSSWWVNLFGHGHPHIKTRIKAQLDQLEHVMLAGFTHAPVIELSERLSARTGGTLGHAFYGSDGASATEIALKMSFHYWRNTGKPEKTGFIHLSDSYHGETIGSLSVTDVAIFKDTYAALVKPSAEVPSPDTRKAGVHENADMQAAKAAAALEAHLAAHHATTAALIVEPLVQGAAGMAMYSPQYLRRARELCDQYQVHLICDEIAVGFGRTGSFFACEQAGIWPDLICLSKGITGGFLPLSVVMCTDSVYQAFYHDEVTKGFLHSHSYTGNPLACSAALATLDLFDQDDVLARNRATADHINTLAAALKALPYVRDFRQAGTTGAGMIWAFEVEDAPIGFAQQLFAAGLKRELLLRPMGNTVYWMPPYCLSHEEAGHLVSATFHALQDVMGQACGVISGIT
ncbi:adenosylmethionine--8-amino-7-oxononanoate transaminase [Leeia oryzae]|uniref:adenosylmethionine--8-amino-7-oxononanoate transaminase n=1 Tax=Leeia oryzae TaxID=356662 RepID=UPI000379E23D|nr:adenosylmethionine--8-amino-7-oxononanoate transaminase [Leeia oryzae]